MPWPWPWCPHTVLLRSHWATHPAHWALTHAATAAQAQFPAVSGHGSSVVGQGASAAGRGLHPHRQSLWRPIWFSAAHPVLGGLPVARAWFPGAVHSCTGRVVRSEPIFHSGRAHSLAAWHGFPWTGPVWGGAGIGFSTARQGFAVVGGRPWFFGRQALFSVAPAERAHRGWAWFAATQAQFTGGPGKVFHCPACI